MIQTKEFRDAGFRQAVQSVRNRYFEFAPDKFEGRYWHSNGYGCTVVASISDWDNGQGDWAAYIGGAPGRHEEEDLEFVAAHGAKLSREDALHFFPEMAKVPYRP